MTPQAAIGAIHVAGATAHGERASSPGPEIIVTDSALVALTLREQAAEARARLAATRDPEALLKIAHDLARAARLELEILTDGGSVASREILMVVETALRRAREAAR